MLIGLRLVLAAGFLAVGLYYEAGTAVMAAALAVWLIIRSRKNGLKIGTTPALFAALLIPIGYMISSMIAVDRGLAFWGVVRTLPLPFLAICLMQVGEDGRERILKDLPWIGAGMTVLSLGLQMIPALHADFMINGRLGGCFQYPNTFACFLLIGWVIGAVQKEEKVPAWADWVRQIVLLTGILLAGSRTVFILTVPAAVMAFVMAKGRRLSLGISLICGAAVGAGLALLMQANAIGRIGQISAGESTWLGRLLYWKDALPVIARHPLGLGYLGYYFLQGSFQTGVYSVRWVHNDLLQLLLDIGWIPVILALIVIVRSLLGKGSLLRKTVLVILLAHSFVDFDLEFIAMYTILFVCLDWKSGKETVVSTGMLTVVSLVLVLPALYVGVASAFSYQENWQTAAKLYPGDTFAQMGLLTEAEEPWEMDAIATRILRKNQSVALAWDGKAQAAYAEGDFGRVIECKEKALDLNPYGIEDYIDTFEKLKVGVRLYQEAGDTDSARICRERIAALEERLEAVRAKTDPLAYRLADQPDLTMPDEYYTYLQ